MSAELAGKRPTDIIDVEVREHCTYGEHRAGARLRVPVSEARLLPRVLMVVPPRPAQPAPALFVDAKGVTAQLRRAAELLGYGGEGEEESLDDVGEFVLEKIPLLLAAYEEQRTDLSALIEYRALGTPRELEERLHAAASARSEADGARREAEHLRTQANELRARISTLENAAQRRNRGG